MSHFVSKYCQMTLKHTLICTLSHFGFAMAPVSAEDTNWMVDFDAAKTKAVQEEKSLLVNFTGSDWCGWCIRLVEEVFSKDAFEKGVEDKFVLVELDFPRDKSEMSEETITQNEKLQSAYAVSGFPTIFLMDGKGRPFARTGYLEGGPAPYLESLNSLLEVREKRDEYFEKAANLEGSEKAEANLNALKLLTIDDELLMQFYGEEIAQIKESGLEEGLDFISGIESAGKFAQFESELQALGSAGKNEEALKLVNETLENGGFKGERQQQVAVIKAIVLAEMGEFDDSLKAIDEAKAMAPDSPVASRLDDFKAQIEVMKTQPPTE